MTPVSLQHAPITARGAPDDAGVRWRAAVGGVVAGARGGQQVVTRSDRHGTPRRVAGVGAVGAIWITNDRTHGPGTLRAEMLREYRGSYAKPSICELLLPADAAIVLLDPDADPLWPAVWRVARNAPSDGRCYVVPWPTGRGSWRQWMIAASRARAGLTAAVVDLATPGCDPWRWTHSPPPPGGLLPPNASPLERELARIAIGRIAALDVPLRSLHDPARCPAAWLPWLAWQRRVEPWDPTWSDDEMRAAIAGSAGAYRRHGTPAADRAALDRLGRPWRITERPGGRHHVVRVHVGTSAERAADPQLGARALAALDASRRASVHYESSAIDLQEIALAPTVGVGGPVLAPPVIEIDLVAAAA